MIFFARLFTPSAAISIKKIQEGKTELYKVAEYAFVYENEISNCKIYNVDILNSIITSEVISLEKKYVNCYSKKAVSTLMFGTNNSIEIIDKITTANGMDRRVLLLKWTKMLYYKNGESMPQYYRKGNVITLNINQQFKISILHKLINKKNEIIDQIKNIKEKEELEKNNKKS